MDDTETSSFGQLLRHYRLAASLTQEALAERSGLGPRSLQHLERGETRPQRVTAHRLAVALGLPTSQRTAFEALAQPVPRQRARGERATFSPAAGEGAGSSVLQTQTARGGDGDPRVALTAPPRVVHNLPLPLTSFIGRDQEVATVSRLLGATRLLTLTGAGGCGKTRLALQVAATLLNHQAHGVWLVALAPLADPDLVPQAVATALGLREEPGQPLTATLTAALRRRQLVLVLDNCEHLIEACARVAVTLLGACPDVRILATSREALGLAGEVAWRVPSLAVPAVGSRVSVDALGQVEAVRLFVERTRAGHPHFALTAQNAAAVAQICRRLDGLPLAIELAAARVRVLAVDQLARRLDQRFRLLTGGNRATLPRQQTLRATIDWSYDLLSAPEQTLFARLSVFVGSFTLEAVETVCAGGEVPPDDVLDVFLRLVDKSLVAVEESGGDIARYRLLETLRQYGDEQLLARGEAEALAARHATHYRALAEEAEPLLRGPHRAVWCARLAAEQMNLRHALRWMCHVGTAQDGLRLAGALGWFWHYEGYFGEGRHWLTTLLALPDAMARTPARAKALCALGWLRRMSRLVVGSQVGDPSTQTLVAEAIAIARDSGDTPLLARGLWLLGGWVAREDAAAGRALLTECLALCRAPRSTDLLHDALSDTLNTLGDIAWEQGDVVAARTWWEENLSRLRQDGDRTGIAIQLGDLGMMAYHEGNDATAREQLEESLALYRAEHHPNFIALTLGCLGAVARAQGDTARARTCYEEKLAFWQEVGDRAGIAATLAELGGLAQQEGDMAQAQALFQEALSVRHEVGAPDDIAASLAHLGDLAAAHGDAGQAQERYTAALRLVRLSGDKAVTALCLEGLASVAWSGGDGRRAARLYGAAAVRRRAAFVLFVWDERAARERQITAVRTTLGDAVFAASWAEGQVMTLAQAVADGRTMQAG